MICSTCDGMRFVDRRVPQYQTYNVHRKDGVPCAPRDGGIATLERFPTGRTVTHRSLCDDCGGTGLAVDPAHDPDCHLCRGTGVRNAYAAGEWETEDCQCSAPVADLEAS